MSALDKRSQFRGDPLYSASASFEESLGRSRPTEIRRATMVVRSPRMERNSKRRKKNCLTKREGISCGVKLYRTKEMCDVDLMSDVTRLKFLWISPIFYSLNAAESEGGHELSTAHKHSGCSLLSAAWRSHAVRVTWKSITHLHACADIKSTCVCHWYALHIMGGRQKALCHHRPWP